MTVLMHGYIIFGLLAAGVIREFISDDYIKNNLGGKGLWPSVKAAFIGLPLPICSCGVIPLAASLKKSGAGRGAVTSFFISTPMTGVDSVIATYGVFGWVVTVFRILSASLSAVFAGYLTDRFLPEEAAEEEKEGGSCCSGSCCGSTGAHEKPTALKRFSNIFRYAFGELLSDLAYPLFAGLLMAAFITMLITPEMTGGSTGAVAGYLIAFAAGIPLYVCSISAIPVAMSLIVAGFSPGAAFVFLAAAPATNVVALNVIRGMLGVRGLFIYVMSIVFFTLGSALLIDWIYMDSGLSVAGFIGEEESYGLFATLTSALFLAVIAWLTFRQKLVRR